jgi:hypothetical protein
MLMKIMLKLLNITKVLLKFLNKNLNNYGNIEEIIDADVREDFINDICQYKVGDVVWVITEKRFGIIEDRNVAKGTSTPIYRVRVAPSLILTQVPQDFLNRPPHIRR